MTSSSISEKSLVMITPVALLESPIAETLEHLRANSNLSSTEWYELLEVNWHDYQGLKANSLTLSENSVQNISDYFKLKPEQILNGNIDFKELTLRMEQGPKDLPQIYSKAAFGRQRTSITSLDFVEHFGGWRLRSDTIKKMGVSETVMLDPFASISMKFITDLCSYLERRQFQKKDFFNMGAYSFVSNSNSVIGKILSEMPNSAVAYDFFFNECLKLFEQNCNYTVTKMGKNELTIEYVTNPDVAAESGVRHLGNKHVCQLKSGFIAMIPRYLDLPPAKINKLTCVHCGDPVCTLEIDISDANKAQLKRLF